ncbi:MULTISPECIES: DUF4240 domain-containing protein [Shewanella]|jgi:hypothetical protein|uniref:DUF4240 domain-containing protein n=1 Tax=Shewanella TaxID=22 RepID=UPI000DAF96A0|nr:MULTISPECIES: DUF4240 domain-containing protein [Shewanella]PZP33961.1 MAG: hypothetical protein DI594_09160 [Shewanella oneidensis]MCL1072411.1 DUF4240 domain-containing protein [Shewanella xiamenensis]MCR4532839.1 DUF4240 domain-containing protein [Shewanella xiamenensis]MCT8861148.1 DUF4240 domain-containing protein [Shewanella xiamenensis]MCT8864494.1 DUF4240 domain-containing protein [Shewanella xiamenensis]
MTEVEFWDLVTRSEPAQSQESLVEALKLKLSKLSDEELKVFDKLFGQQMRRSYLWSVWGAAYIITGCDSDYAFAEFRAFLISLGQARYEAVIAQPDSLAKLTAWPEKDGYAYPFIEDYDLIAGQLYEDRTGKELPFMPSGKATPVGKKFSTKPKDLRLQYPELSARFPF